MKGRDVLGRGPRGRSRGRRRRSARTVALAGAALAYSTVIVAGIVEAHVSGSVPPPAYDRLATGLFATAFVIAGIVFAALLVSVRRYREGSAFPRGPVKTDDRPLEIAWTALPAIIVSFIAIASTQALQVSEVKPPDGITIGVTGMQYQWVFTYPDGNVSVDDLWIEEGQAVYFEIRSIDVVHSFYIPHFRLKVDAFPNDTHETWIVAKPAGNYELYCAEFCGLSHGEMRGMLHVFAKGLSDRPYGPPPGQGPPPPPPVTDFYTNVSLEEKGGPAPQRPWSIQPPIVVIPISRDVHVKVHNNASVALGVATDPPYGLRTGPIPPGGSAWLNFTADKPTAGEPLFADNSTARDKGMESMMLVGVPLIRPKPPPAAPTPFPTGWALVGLALVVLLASILAAKRMGRGGPAPAAGAQAAPPAEGGAERPGTGPPGADGSVGGDSGGGTGGAGGSTARGGGGGA